MKKTQNKGITLIALIVTIIVLLILAGITISLTIGQGGILNRAQEAGIEHEKAQIKEELELAILDIKADKLSKGQSMKREDLKELEKIGAIMESTETPAKGEYKDYYFEVDEDYVVTIIGKIEGESPSIEAKVITTGIVSEGGTVEIKVTASISEGTITALEATNGAELKTTTSATEKVFEVSANGTYTFKATADNGRSAVASVEVNTIIEKPVIEIKDITKTGFTIAVTNNYKEGLITEYKYYVSGSVVSEGTTAKEFAVTGLTEETEYTNIYVEAYTGETKLTSETTTAETKPIGLEYSWEELAKVAKAISDNDDTITRDTAEVKMTIDGKEYTLKVGDITKVKVDGVAKTVRIMGFNHDTLTDSSAYGEGETNTYAGISFEFVDFITNTSMNSSDSNSGGWAASELRSILNSTTINSLSNSEYIKQVNKSYIEIYYDATSVKTTLDKLWLLSSSEIWNNGYQSGYYGYTIAKEGEQYKYYKDLNANCWDEDSRLVKNSKEWWLRSLDYYNDRTFCAVSWRGKMYNTPADEPQGVAPGFSI